MLLRRLIQLCLIKREPLPKVRLKCSLVTVNPVSEEELIRMIASVESSSTHPIAKAVVNYAGRRDIELSSVTDSKEYAGLGLEAAVNGIQVLAGNGVVSKFQIEYPPELLSITDTIVVCAIGNKYAGYLLLSDSLKEDAKIVIQNLESIGNSKHSDIIR